MLFSVAKRTTGGFSRIYRPGGRADERRGEDGRGGKRGRGKENMWERKREKIGDTVKSRSSLNQINCNQLHRTGDGIASLKIQ